MKGEDMAIAIQTLTIAGQRFVVIPENQYRQLLGENREPPLPEADAKGNYPAVESARIVLARQIIRRRRAAGLTQSDLARLSGVRVETISRLEHGKHSPNVATVDKLVRILKGMEGKRKRPNKS
ncbi:MAG: helix-turn-helix transcriptional regulator [Thermoguttaceae bacterium]|jgi:DNA-binding XRE family transcriptional regulator